MREFQHRFSAPRIGTLLLAAMLLCVPPVKALPDDDDLDDLYRNGGSCTRTAVAAVRACKLQKQSEGWVKRGDCNNLADAASRAGCEEKAEAAAEKAEDDCDEQFDARLSACKTLGENPHDPKIDPAMFVNPADIGKSVQPNPYWPLNRGRVTIFRSSGETITDTVTAETREILGVQCAVVHNTVVNRAGVLIEDTVDWYAQDILGNVWYFGEIAQNFKGGYLANLNGSWVAGVDGAMAGIMMKALPARSVTYREELSLAVAEDSSEIISLTGSARVPAALCEGDCLVTRNFTPLEPGAVTTKYYLRGVGVILEVDAGTGDRKELVEIRN